MFVTIPMSVVLGFKENKKLELEVGEDLGSPHHHNRQECMTLMRVGHGFMAQS